jgi:hypothetical protein
LQQGLQISEENGWPLLIDVGQQYLANLHLNRWFIQHDSAQLQEVVRQLKSFEQAANFDQSGEFFATLALATYLSGDPEEARAVLQRAHILADESWVTDRVWLDYAEAVVNQNEREKTMAWFREHGFLRAVAFLERVEGALDIQQEDK